MKKYLSMFAFAAAIVFVAFTLASCVEEEEDGPNATHNFTITGIYESNLASVRENPEFQKENEQLVKDFAAEFKNLLMPMTDTQAALVWSQFRDGKDTRAKVQDELDRVAAKYKDRTLSLTLIYLRNGAEWQRAKWTTTYKDNF